MAWLVKKLKVTAQLTDSAAAVVTNATGHKTKIGVISLHNTDSSSRVVTFHDVPNNAGEVGTAADANIIAKLTIPATDSALVCPDWILDGTNDTIQALADVASKVNIAISGLDYSA